MLNKNTIKKIIEEILKIMGFEGEVDAFEEKGETAVFNITSKEAGFLIGAGGENLFALQHIVRALISKRLKGPAQFIIDVNQYRSNRKKLLEELARDIADQVVEGKREIFLQPMSSFERRVIHLFLGERDDVVTESVGEGAERHIIIKPKV